MFSFFVAIDLVELGVGSWKLGVGSWDPKTGEILQVSLHLGLFLRISEKNSQYFSSCVSAVKLFYHFE